jgi:hypothetical protein
MRQVSGAVQSELMSQSWIIPIPVHADSHDDDAPAVLSDKQQTSPPLQLSVPSHETERAPIHAPCATHDAPAPPASPPIPAVAQQTCVAALHVTPMPHAMVPVEPPSLCDTAESPLSNVSPVSAPPPPSVVAVPSGEPPASVPGELPSLVDPPHATASATALEIPIVTSRRP